MPSCVLAADIGTSSLKCALIDPQGSLLAEGLSVYDSSSGTVTATDWENSFVQTAGNLLCKNEGIEIKAICISGNGPTLVPVCAKSETLDPLYWYDAKLPALLKENTSFFLPNVFRFKQNRIADYESTEFFLSSNDWLCWRLGAEPVASLPSPEYEPYYWDEDQCKALNIDINKFPPQVMMGTITGKLSADAALRLGIKPGIPLVAGAPDFISAIIGTGVLKAGMACDRAGSSEGLNLCIPAKINAQGFRVLPHAKQGLWNLGLVIPESGKLIENFRKETGKIDIEYDKLMEELIPAYKPSGVYKEESIDRGRLILETIGFSVRAALEKFLEAGFAINEMIVSGGQAKNRLWNQLKADMTGTTLLIPEIADGELAGNVVLAELALGEISDLEEGAERMIRIKEKFPPVAENVLFWKERFFLNHNSKLF